MVDRQAVEALVRKHGFADFRWISGNEVQVRRWVRFKCLFGCGSYGKNACCPPEVPSVAECRELFGEYGQVLILQIRGKLDDPKLREEWSREMNLELLSLERDVFLAGHHKVFLLFMDECRLCDACPGMRTECRKPLMARPCAEALAVDVFSTVRNAGFHLEVLTGHDQEMNRYAFLLVG